MTLCRFEIFWKSPGKRDKSMHYLMSLYYSPRGGLPRGKGLSWGYLSSSEPSVFGEPYSRRSIDSQQKGSPQVNVVQSSGTKPDMRLLSHPSITNCVLGGGVMSWHTSAQLTDIHHCIYIYIARLHIACRFAYARANVVTLAKPLSVSRFSKQPLLASAMFTFP